MEALDIYATYTICPYAGVICKICKKLVVPHRTTDYAKGILLHEHNDKRTADNHADRHKKRDDLKLRKSFASHVTKTFQAIARQLLVDVDPTERLAHYESILESYIQPRQEYFACRHPDCNGKLIVNKNNHRGKKLVGHMSQCEKAYGYLPKYWENGTPIAEPFDIELKKNFCDLFWMTLQEIKQELAKERLVVPPPRPRATQPTGLTATASTVTAAPTKFQPSLHEKLQKRLQTLNEIHTDIAIQPQSVKEANPWLRRVGWDHALKGLNMQFLIDMGNPIKDDELSLQLFIKTFESMVDSSIKCYSENTNPSSHDRS